MPIRKILLLLLILSGYVTRAQSGKQLLHDSLEIEFRDTLYLFAVDSLYNDLGEIDPRNERMVKYIKYLGDTPIHITRVWTSDPHFICGYPQGVLEKNKVYPIKICFYHRGKMGPTNKSMGLDFSNGKQLNFHFKGHYPEPVPIPEPPTPKKTEPSRTPFPADSILAPVIIPQAMAPDTPVHKPKINPEPKAPIDSNLLNERHASFPGGNEALVEYLDSHFNKALADEIGEYGLMVVEFTVNTDGSLSDFKIKKSLNPVLDKELIRVMKTSPRWIPEVCSNVDPAWYLDPTHAHYYCAVKMYMPYRVKPGNGNNK